MKTPVPGLFAALFAAAILVTPLAAQQHSEGDGHDHSGHAHGPGGHGQQQVPLPPAEQAVVDELQKLNAAQPKSEAEAQDLEKQADKVLKKLATEFPNSPNFEEYNFGYVQLLMRATRFEEAEAHWRAYMKSLKDQVKVYRGHRLLADLLKTAGKREEAVKLLQEYMKQNPDAPQINELRVALAEMHSGAGNDAAAADLLAEQVKLHPDAVATPTLRLQMVRYRVRARQFDEALKALEESRKTTGSEAMSANTTYLMGWTLDQKGDTQAALAQFQKVQADPQPQIAAQGFLAESEMWQKRGDGQKALEALDGAIKKLGSNEAAAQLADRKRILEMLGKPAPEFAIKTIDGKPLALADYRGKHALIDFWATWCLPCIEELPNLKALQSKFKPPQLNVIGVSLDKAGLEKKVEEFVKKHALPWPVGMSTTASAATTSTTATTDPAVLYGIRAIPFIVLVDPDGKVRTAGLTGKELEAAVTMALEPKK